LKISKLLIEYELICETEERSGDTREEEGTKER
jgi:hypothetical protein